MTGAATILRMIQFSNPELIATARGRLDSAQPICADTIRRLHIHIFTIHTSHDSFHDLIIFLACGLALFSPESLIADCKVRNGVCSALADCAGISRLGATYHINRYVRHYYAKKAGVREVVDSIAGRFRK